MNKVEPLTSKINANLDFQGAETDAFLLFSANSLVAAFLKERVNERGDC